MKKGEVIHVAFADDHVTSRMAIADFLKKLGGISVDIQADNGKDLIAKLKMARERPGICMLDVSMPVMDGLQALVAIKKLWPDMKFLIMSAFASEHLVIPMIRNGAGGYLVKTCHPDELKQALIDIHETGTYRSEFITKALWKDRGVELSEVEKDVLRQCCSDLTYAEIGKALGKSRKSVEGHRDALFKKLQVNTRTGLAMYAVQSGLVPLETIQ